MPSLVNTATTDLIVLKYFQLNIKMTALHRLATNSNGNVIFIILIAVMLFAALGYAVTSSSRGGGSNANKEKDAIGLANLLDFAATVRSAASRIALGNGLPYEVMYNSEQYMNAGGSKLLPMGTPANPAIYVFHPQGGAVAPLTFEDVATDCHEYGCIDNGSSPKTGTVLFSYAKIPGVGSDEAEIIMRVYAINSETCLNINKKLGLTKVFSLDLDAVNYQTSSAVNPAPTGGSALSDMTRPDAALVNGLHEFCYVAVNASGASHRRYQFLAVLFAR